MLIVAIVVLCPLLLVPLLHAYGGLQRSAKIYAWLWIVAIVGCLLLAVSAVTDAPVKNYPQLAVAVLGALIGAILLRQQPARSGEYCLLVLGLWAAAGQTTAGIVGGIVLIIGGILFPKALQLGHEDEKQTITPGGVEEAGEQEPEKFQELFDTPSQIPTPVTVAPPVTPQVPGDRMRTSVAEPVVEKAEPTEQVNPASDSLFTPMAEASTEPASSLGDESAVPDDDGVIDDDSSLVNAPPRNSLPPIENEPIITNDFADKFDSMFSSLHEPAPVTHTVLDDEPTAPPVQTTVEEAPIQTVEDSQDELNSLAPDTPIEDIVVEEVAEPAVEQEVEDTTGVAPSAVEDAISVEPEHIAEESPIEPTVLEPVEVATPEPTTITTPESDDTPAETITEQDSMEVGADRQRTRSQRTNKDPLQPGRVKGMIGNKHNEEDDDTARIFTFRQRGEELDKPLALVGEHRYAAGSLNIPPPSLLDETAWQLKVNNPQTHWYAGRTPSLFDAVNLERKQGFADSRLLGPGDFTHRERDTNDLVTP